MTRLRTLSGRVAATLQSWRSAAAAVAAIEAGRHPERHDLARLGIDPKVFLSMGHG